MTWNDAPIPAPCARRRAGDAQSLGDTRTDRDAISISRCQDHAAANWRLSRSGRSDERDERDRLRNAPLNRTVEVRTASSRWLDASRWFPIATVVEVRGGFPTALVPNGIQKSLKGRHRVIG